MIDLFGFSLFKVLLFGLSFVKAILKSGERFSLLLITYSLFPELLLVCFSKGTSYIDAWVKDFEELCLERGVMMSNFHKLSQGFTSSSRLLNMVSCCYMIR